MSGVVICPELQCLSQSQSLFVVKEGEWLLARVFDLSGKLPSPLIQRRERGISRRNVQNKTHCQELRSEREKMARE